MEKSLKEQNRLALRFVVAANATIYIAVLGGDWTIAGLAGELVSLREIVAAPLLTVLVGIANAQIDHNNKDSVGN